MSVERKDDFERGLEHRRDVLGSDWVDNALAQATSFDADFQSLITRYAWNDVWGRPGLDHTTRRLLVLGMTMGLARWDEFELHCESAARMGVPLEKISETLLQGAIYCGVPAANTAFKIMKDVLRKQGRPLAAQPMSTGVRVSSHDTFSAPQLRVRIQGEGAPVVLSHALGLDSSMWDAYAADLAASGRQVLRYDHRGHGCSACPAGPYTMDDLVDDAARVIQEWGRGPVAWVGLSMGGMVGQGLAIKYPKLVDRLVLSNTTSRYPPGAVDSWMQRISLVESLGMAGVADIVMERYLQAEFRAKHPEIVDRLRSRLLSDDPLGYVASCHAVANVSWYERLSEIDCPVLVIAGGQDQGTPPAMGHEIAREVAKGASVVVEHSAHLSVIDAADEFYRVTKNFLLLGEVAR